MKSPKLSQRALVTPPSPIRKLAPLARAARSRGISIYPLNIGQPDLPSPAEFLSAISSYTAKTVAYEDSRGNPELLQAWSHFMKRSLGLEVSPDYFLITTGASEGLVLTFMVCCDPGDEVIVFDPTYANYLSFAAIAGVRLRPLVCDETLGFPLPSLSSIEAAINGKTKAVLVCNPNNPTGTVYPQKEILKLAELCAQHSLFLVLDETYRELVYDGLSPYSVLHLTQARENIIVIDSLSKRFSLCGARLGCLITTNQQVLEHMLSMAQARLAAPTIEQHAAVQLLNSLGPEYIAQVRAQYEQRRDALLKALQGLAGVTAYKPQGAFYCLVRLPVHNVEDFARFMLSEFDLNGTTTFIAPAAGFYIAVERGRSLARIAFVLDSQSLVRAVEVLGAGLKRFKQT